MQGIVVVLSVHPRIGDRCDPGPRAPCICSWIPDMSVEREKIKNDVLAGLREEHGPACRETGTFRRDVNEQETLHERIMHDIVTGQPGQPGQPGQKTTRAGLPARVVILSTTTCFDNSYSRQSRIGQWRCDFVQQSGEYELATSSGAGHRVHTRLGLDGSRCPRASVQPFGHETAACRPGIRESITEKRFVHTE
jgi:hypothetical protein